MIMELTGLVERLADINTDLEHLATIVFERIAVIPQELAAVRDTPARVATAAIEIGAPGFASRYRWPRWWSLGAARAAE
jgi:hypothetical protein